MKDIFNIDNTSLVKRLTLVAKAYITPIIAILLTLQSPSATAGYESGLDKFNAGKFAAAAKDFEVASDEGDKYARFMLAKMLINGQGVKANPKRGLELIADLLSGLDDENKKLRADLQAQTSELRALRSEQENTRVARSRVGQQICKFGALSYSYQPKSCTGGRCVYVNQILRDSVSDGEALATVEGMSADGKRVQVRIVRWFSNQFGRVEPQRQLTDAPMLDGILSLKPGNIFWDEDHKWTSCTY